MTERRITTGLKSIFFLHAIVAAVFGLGFLLIPANMAGWFNLPIQDDLPGRLIGATLVALAIGSFVAFRETFFEKVRIVLELNIVWDVLALLVSLWALFIGPTVTATEAVRGNVYAWVATLSLAFFAIAFGYLYFHVPEESAESAARHA